jgi:hypothetical protein
MGKVGAAMSPVRVRHLWPDRVAYATVIWSVAYAGLGLAWALGADSFPFGVDNDPGARVSVLASAQPEITGSVVTGYFALAAALAAVMTRPVRRRWLRVGLIWFAAVTAVTLALVIPDYRVLVLVAYVPILLAGAPFGWPPGADLLDALTWPLINQFVLIAGGLLWAATAVVFMRLTHGACPTCGRTDALSGWTAPTCAARWGRQAVYVAVAVPLVYAATRWAWALGIPLGISTDLLRYGQESGLWVIGAALGAVAASGALLTVGLAAPWGEVVPRWVPLLGRRSVAPWVAIVPAGVGAVTVTIAGLMFVRTTLFGGFSLGPQFDLSVGGDWAAIAPELLWPIWGVALAVAAAGYYYRRRNVCRRCGRR